MFTGKFPVTLVVLLTVILVTVSDLSAQNDNWQTRRLLQKLESAEGKQKCELLFKLTEIHIDTDIKQAEKYAKKAYREARSLKNKSFEADALNQIGTIFYRNKEYNEAIKYYEEELDLRTELKDYYDLALVSYNLALSYQYEGKERQAIKSYENSLGFAKKVGFKHLILLNNEALFHLNYDRYRYKKALDYFKAYVDIKDSTFMRKRKRQMAILKTQHEKALKDLSKADSTLKIVDSTLTIVEKQKDTLQEMNRQKSLQIQNLELEAQLQQEELKNQKLENRNYRIVLLTGIIGSLILLILALMIYRRYKYKKLVNAQLEQKNEELRVQKEEIATQRDEIQAQRDLANEQRAEIVSGINYALRIQQAMLPGEEFLRLVVPSYFVLNKPRDIVSGDFYQVFDTDTKLILAVADCTGHGVPGAFMSVLGMTLLNELIHIGGLTDAKSILTQMRERVKETLKQTGKLKEAKDGMDMALCVLDKESYMLDYAGAFNPLYIVRGDELIELKPTRTPVGIHYKEKVFESKQLQIYKGDSLYLFSDGYVDQFGRENEDDKLRKFKTKRFKKLLLEIKDRPPADQKRILDQTIEDWKEKAYEQVDDILIMGVFA